ncbi:hypothetical protein PQQ88_26925 [Paraburkholderia caledonica]|uniref:hypothetical protein n=1 Tax=Paraburkholderia caledonica TaxID=134536 RepID=UPI000ADEA3C9|nr:hypothetical protein [Paraburkholderia caledonica]
MLAQIVVPVREPSRTGRLDLVEPRSRIRVADLGIILDAVVSGRGIAWLPAIADQSQS